jgi:eukaryotic-like serine/threonine-protein kinase
MVGLETPISPTTIFDPDSLLRAKRRPANEEEDNTLTIPRAPSADPPVRRPDLPVDEDAGTLPIGGAGRDELVSWNIRLDPTTKDPLCGRTISSGKYTLDSLIGSGAIGMVFKASHRDLGRTVAIKVLNPRYRDDAELLRVFRTEARAASQLEHANVARIYDYGQEPDGLVYIVMEYLSGYTLGNALGTRKRLTLQRALDIMMQACAGLSAAHDRGIVHRDVKPDNIVLVPAQDDEGRPVETVKVCDFGIAALGTAKAPADHAAGTPEYMAPEQGLGEPATPAADVYACGIVLYEMLTGEVPFTGTQPYKILLKHQKETPAPPSSVEPTIPPEIDAVVLRALEKKPALRFQSARELRSELRRVVSKLR